MIILLNESGQLGNRLRSLSNLVALGIENKQNVWCPAVPKELNRYINFKYKENALIQIHFSYSMIMSLLIKMISKVGLWNDSPAPTKKINIYSNWITFAKPELTQKHYKFLSEYFGFKKEFCEHCSKLLPPKENSNELRIAVHLRRNDYRTWKNGKYYYEESVFINQMLSIHKENKNVQFLIFTNDTINKNLFLNCDFRVFFMHGSAFEDLCTMSMCDYIFGPPSTFSAWAGYVGNRSLAWLRNSKHVYKLEEFQNVPESMSSTKSFWSLD